jgi:hypothetical protein
MRVIEEVKEQTSCRKNISLTVAAPRPIAAPTPKPLKTLPTIRVPQVLASPVPSVARTPMSVDARYTGLLPYTFASGFHISGHSPTVTMVVVVWYDASVVEMLK